MHGHSWRGVAIAAITVISAATLGCADFDTPIDPSGGAPDEMVATPSFAADIVPIFEKRCALGGCHSLATRQAGLALTPDAAYDALVDVPSALVAGQVRVRPSDPAGSWLVTMIVPTTPRGWATIACHSRRSRSRRTRSGTSSAGSTRER